MGGGDTSPPPAPAPPPAPPSPAETTREAIQAQIESLPEILGAQREFGPQFSEVQLEQLREFGPQFAEVALDLQREFAPEFREVQEALTPEIAAAQRTLTDFLSQTDEEEFQRLKPGVIEDVRNAQSVRGIGDISPLGAVDEAVQIERLRKQLKDRRLNVALTTAGRLPVNATPTVSPTAGAGGRQLVKNVSPESIFAAQSGINAFNASTYGTRANIFGTESGAAVARRGQNFDLISQFIPNVEFGL